MNINVEKKKVMRLNGIHSLSMYSLMYGQNSCKWSHPGNSSQTLQQAFVLMSKLKIIYNTAFEAQFSVFLLVPGLN